MNHNPYHIELWPIPPDSGQGRIQMIKAAATLQAAKERMRALVHASNWKSYRCGVYLLQDGQNNWQELWEIKEGKAIKLV